MRMQHSQTLEMSGSLGICGSCRMTGFETGFVAGGAYLPRNQRGEGATAREGLRRPRRTTPKRRKPNFVCRIVPEVEDAVVTEEPIPEQTKPKLTGIAGVQQWFEDKLLMGVAPNPELAAILTVYFVQGVLGLSKLAVSFFLKDDLQLSPAAAAAITGGAMIPWLVKPLYGFVSDSIPIAGFRRRSYLVIAGLLGCSSWSYLALAANSEAEVLAATVLSSISFALSDVVADSMVVERARREGAAASGALQSLCWGSLAVGGLISAYFSGSLLQTFGARPVFAFTAALPLVTASLAGVITEKRMAFKASKVASSFKKEGALLWEAVSRKEVWIPTLCVFLWEATPNVDSAMFFFNTNELNFDAEFLGRVRLVSSAAGLIGTLVYQRFLRKVPVSDVLIGSTLISVPLALTQLLLVTHFNRVIGIDDHFFALTDSALLTAIGYVGFMPTLVLAARFCPPGVEGALFATLMSVFNAAGLLSTELGALMIKSFGVTESNFTNLPTLVAICSLAPLVTLPLLAYTKPIVEGVSYSEDKAESEE